MLSVLFIPAVVSLHSVFYEANAGSSHRTAGGGIYDRILQSENAESDLHVMHYRRLRAAACVSGLWQEFRDSEEKFLVLYSRRYIPSLRNSIFRHARIRVQGM
jgi:hypothetical protein